MFPRVCVIGAVKIRSEIKNQRGSFQLKCENRNKLGKDAKEVRCNFQKV